MMPPQSDSIDPVGEPFWRSKTLDEMTDAEWEALCDGCGRCCLNKLEDDESGEVFWTNIACRLLDREACRCRNYTDRHEIVPDCLPLTPASVPSMSWLPPTCAYRLVNEDKDLYWWHPLVSGSGETVHAAGVSVRGRTVEEKGLTVYDFENYLVDWPGEKPS